MPGIDGKPCRARRARPVLTTLGATALLAACSTLQQIAALRQVDFAIDRVADARLAGVGIDDVRDYDDLSATQLARIGLALAGGRLPLDFQLHLTAANPADNAVAARLLRMDWSLWLENTETISGTLDRTYVLEPGQPQDIPITISLDLLEFFDRNSEDLIDLVLAVTGQGGAPRTLSLRARPTIDTPIGPIRYPEPITIVSREVGATVAR
jgi:hypothetical protein